MDEKFSPSYWIRKIGGILGRSLIVGGANVFLLMIGNAAAQAVGLRSFSIGGPVDPGLSLVILFVSGVLIGLIMGPVASRLPLRPTGRIAVLFVALFVLNSAANVIEALFFTTIPYADLTFSLFVSAFEYGGLAALLAFLFQPISADRGLTDILGEILGTRRWFDWLARFLLAGVSYLPIYFLFGAIAAPYVVPYYQDPALGLQLTIPGFDVILPLEVGRGFLYALTLFPLTALLWSDDARSRRGIAFWIILVQAVLGSWHPMLNAAFWPAEMRLAHGLEITADCIVYGFLFVWLMAPGRKKPDSVRTDDPAGA